ncbi:uncharacterized protein LOC102061811 isoform X4 [Zonotrichia albicollis]|uniref:uncharacterized protein LOC102061811 isoform X4 n=1 Tax=Zonotrichia albicollis TaxID=44394 RepID=UPI003D812472
MVTREDASGFLPRPLTLLANQHSRRGTANGDAGGAGAALPWQRGGRACGGKSEKRSLGAELEAERGRVHELEVELKALKGQSQHLGAELEAEKSRSHRLEVELEAEKGRSQQLEAELKTERGRSQVLRVELDALRGRGQRLEAELDAEKGRSQILEMELETLRGRGLGPEGAEPSPEQVLLGRWRQKVFQLLLQVSLQRGQELRLQGQVRSLGAAVAAGSRQVSLLELRLRQGEQERQALSQERLRAEAAEEELGKLGQALSRLLGTLGVALADVTVAVGALGTLSERLGRAQHRLQALVASGWLRWQRKPEGTAGDSSTVAPEVTSEVRGWHRGDTRGGSVPRVSPPCPPQATKGGDRTQPRPGTVPHSTISPMVSPCPARSQRWHRRARPSSRSSVVAAASAMAPTCHSRCSSSSPRVPRATAGATAASRALSSPSRATRAWLSAASASASAVGTLSGVPKASARATRAARARCCAASAGATSGGRAEGDT